MAIPTASTGGLAVTYDASLADLSLHELIAALISLSQRFGRILPVHRIDPATGVCSCGGFVRREGKTTDVPCHAGKHPNLWKWQVCASSNPQQIAKLAAKYPRGNWGIVTGELTDIIDVDTRPSVNGMDSLRALEAEIGIDLMAIAVVVKTGNGIQLYFAHDPAGRLKTTAGIRPGIDIRAGHKGKGLGMVLAPGSKHPNGNTYRIVSGLENGLQTVPETLIQALYKNQQVNPKSNNSLFTVGCGGGVGGKRGNRVAAGDQRFQILPGAELSAERKLDLEVLLSQRPKFKSTWGMSRANSPWPFRDNRNSPPEHEGGIAFFLVWAGWSEQEVMDGITVWRRERSLNPPVHYSRYACTIGKAVAMVTPRALCAASRKESKGAWKHAQTKERILGCIIETPRTPKQIAEVTGIEPVHARVILRRLAKDGNVIRDHHTYLCAPHAVPWYLRNIPEDAGEDSGEELAAEYAEWVAAGMPGPGTVEEEIAAEITTPADAELNMDELEAEYQKYVAELGAGSESAAEYDVEPPLESPAARIPATEASWLDCTDAELEAANVIREPDYSKVKHYSLAALKREKKWKGYASRFTVTANDLELRRLMAMDRPPLVEDTNLF
jgi:hypothetical protein